MIINRGTPRTGGNIKLSMYLSLWGSDEGVPLEQLNEGNLSLQQSQPHPNTAAWTKTKRHVTQLRPLGFLLCCEPAVGNTKIIISHSLVEGLANYAAL